MGWTTADIPDLSGRTAVVTGANGGLGLETAYALAGAGAHVVLAARNQDKAADALARVREAAPGASAEVVPLDLGSLASVAEAARAVTDTYDRVDLLVNNAGLMAVAEGRTEDGFERQLGVNHLGHFALTAHLLPALLAADGARVVNVTSSAHHLGRALDPDDPHLSGSYGPWKAYGQSKLANFHFTLGLHRRLRAAGVSTASLMAHPGLSNTELQRTSVVESGGGLSQRLGAVLAARTGTSAADGALPQLRAATDPSARSGEMWAPRYHGSGPPVRRPVLRRVGLTRAIERLWAVSERETGVTLDPGQAAASRR
jgi:NAD(P)-dependent dehydrogenase (short-subunit alcohol dehydrogenase family)